MGQKKDVKKVTYIKITKETILFFDMDGTLVDTNFANFHAYEKAILCVTKSDIKLTYNPNIRLNRSNLKKFIPNLTEKELIEIIKEKEILYNDFLHETTLISEIEKILLKYYKTNRTILVSNCLENRAIKTLNYHGLYDKFSTIFYREINEYTKNINKFQRAISILDVSPEQVVVFENEEIEIDYAIKAGIMSINPIIL